MKHHHTNKTDGHHDKPSGAEPSPETDAEWRDPPPKTEPSEAEKLQDQLLRLQADFDNFRKRTVRDRTELAQRATEDLMAELLPILDHFEMGLRTAREQQADKAIVDGFQLVYDQLVGTLKKAGLTPIDALGEAFNPHLHEAIVHISSEEFPADAVMEQTRRGYRLGEKLLRASQVIVSSGPAAPPSRGDAAGDS